MPRAIWKGAITFGLVHIPVALYPASSETGIDFDWLDKRSMDPVGYKRVNKRTGKEVPRDNIVKGVKVNGGDYVVLSDEEIKAAYPKTTQTIEIEGFVNASDLAFTQFDKPYYLEPISKGEKVYALLREAMQEGNVVGIARVVMHTKEHLAALIPTGPALMLNTLRWADAIRSGKDISLPAAGKKGLKDSDLKMARQLVKDMTTEWRPEKYEDKFTHAIHALVAKRAQAGETKEVAPMEEAPESSNIVDLTELLRKSLHKEKSGGASNQAQTTARKHTRKSASRKAA